MALHCLQELTERIAETDRVARLAESLLDGSKLFATHGELSELTHRRATANAMTKAALVLLSGYFEGFLKKSIEEFVDQLNDIELTPKDIGNDILLSILQHSVTENRNKSLPKVLKIKNCISGDIHLTLSHDAIGGTKGNPSVDTLESVFQRLGIPEIIDKLSIKDYGLDSTYIITSQSQQLHLHIEQIIGDDVARLQQVLELIDDKWRPKKQRRAVGYVGVIQELLKKRNRIAHGENWGEQVTPTELLNFNQDILRLCIGIEELLSSELIAYTQNSNSG